MESILLAIDPRDPLWIAIAFVCGLLIKLVGLPPLIGFLIAGFLLNAAERRRRFPARDGRSRCHTAVIHHRPETQAAIAGEPRGLGCCSDPYDHGGRAGVGYGAGARRAWPALIPV